MASNRNEPCPCGSGKKHKACCGVRRNRRRWIAPLSLLIFAGLAVWVVAGAVRRVASTPAPAEEPGRVWSEEHGHWHDEENRGTPQPPGPVPPGKVWSAEHGHWHDSEVAGTPQAPGPAPPGKVWSPEHGHWHDVPSSGGATSPPATSGTGGS